MSDDLALLVDIEELLVDFLLAQDEVTAFFTTSPADRVYSVLPDTKVFPAVRVTRYGGAPRTQRPLHLDQPIVQVDAFGGPKRTARDIAETCRAAMAKRLVGSHASGIVTAVDFGGFAYSPDPTFNSNGSARPCYLFRATVTTHPLPPGGS